LVVLLKKSHLLVKHNRGKRESLLPVPETDSAFICAHKETPIFTAPGVRLDPIFKRIEPGQMLKIIKSTDFSRIRLHFPLDKFP